MRCRQDEVAAVLTCSAVLVYALQSWYMLCSPGICSAVLVYALQYWYYMLCSTCICSAVLVLYALQYWYYMLCSTCICSAVQGYALQYRDMLCSMGICSAALEYALQYGTKLQAAVRDIGIREKDRNPITPVQQLATFSSAISHTVNIKNFYQLELKTPATVCRVFWFVQALEN